jgi:hypothetical protein
MKVTQTNLPQEYKQLEYIESNGKQYIDTGFIPTINTTRCFVRFSPLTTGDTAFFGARNGSNPFYFFYNIDNNYTWPISRATKVSGSPALAINNIYIVDWDKGDYKFYDDNYNLLEYGTRSGTNPCNTSMYIFNFQPTDSRSTSAKLYEFKIYSEDVLVRNFVPCIRKSDEEIGLYDLVTNKFFENKGTVAFTAGPENIEKRSLNFTYNYVGYEELEYIQSTGTQYIDTGYIPKTTNCIVELDMAWTGTTASDFESFVGFMATGTTPRNGIHKYTSYYMFGANNTIVSSTAPVSNQRVIIRADFTSGNQKLIINNTQIASATNTYSFSGNTLSMYIFNRNYNGPNNYSKMRLYKCRIYEGSTLVSYLIPCRRLSDSKVGVFDEVSKKFLTNKGTGEFTVGSVKVYENLPDEYQKLEYIESTGNSSSGNQRIKLDIQPTSKYKIESTFAMTKTTITSCLWCARGNSTGVNSTTAFYIANSGLRCDYGASAAMTSIGSVTVNTIHTLTMDSNVWYLDGVRKTSMTAANFTAGSKIQLFASHYNGQDTNLGNYGAYKLYSFRVWNEDGTLVGDFVPCYRKSDNIRGLYDIISKEFYTNAMSGVFNKGDEIEPYTAGNTLKAKHCKARHRILPIEYQQTTFLRNANGAQFIDSDYTPNYNEGGFDIEIGFEPSSASRRYALMATYNKGNAQLSLELNTSNKFRLWMNTGNLDRTSSNNYVANALNIVKVKYLDHEWSIDLNGTITSGTYSTTPGTPDYTCYFFLDRAKRTSTFPYPIKIYYIKIKSGEKLIANYLPCYRKSDNEPGMYDTVGKKFYINEGTGNFTVGENVKGVI